MKQYGFSYFRFYYGVCHILVTERDILEDSKPNNLLKQNS